MSKIRLPERFFAYIITQSLGAFNDNFYKMLLQLYVLQILAAKNAESIISQATFLFTVPFVIFGPWSGYFADKYAKSAVMRVVKFAEIGVMLFGLLAFYLGNLEMMLFILFLMATQSTFFSPAKYGYIPEAAEPEAVTAANGWLEMSTFLFIILGTAVTGFLLDAHNNSTVTVALYCIGFAVIGSLTALFIKAVPAAGTAEKFPWNPFAGIWKDLRFLKRQKPLFLAALANSYFWLIGLIFQTNILIYGKRMLGDAESGNVLLSLLPAFIGIGIGIGSLLASRLSGHKVELGLVPLGGLGMAFAGIALFFTTSSYPLSAAILFIAGAFGGLYIVPLYAYLQFFANEHEKGRVMATSGILNGLFLVLGWGIYHLLAVILGLSPELIYLVMGLVTILAVVYICTVIPEYFVRFCFWLLTHTFYRIRIIGEEHIPLHGPALLTPNHVTYIDSFILGSTVQRFIRFLMLKSFYELPVIKFLFRLMDCIPIDPPAGRASVADSLAQARQKLLENHVVCIFPEGKLTTDGKIDTFRPGFETVMKGLDLPVIPVYIGNLWGSMYSYKDGPPMLKFPRSILRRVTVYYGDPLPGNVTAAEVEAKVREMEAELGEAH